MNNPALRIALFRSPTANVVNDTIHVFEKKHDCRVIVDSYPYDALKQTLLSDLLQHLGQYDAFTYDCTWMAELAEARYLAPLTDLWESFSSEERAAWEPEDILPSVDEVLAKYRGVRYGLPLISNTQVLAYRTDMYQEVLKPKGIRVPGAHIGEEWTWDEYLDAAHVLARETQGRVRGCALRGNPAALLVFMTYPYLFDSTATSSRDRVRTGLARVHQLLDEGLADPTMLLWTHEDPLNWFARGKLGIDQGAHIELLHWLRTKSLAGRVGVVPIPTKSGTPHPTLGGYSIGVAAQSGQSELALRLCLWLSSPEIHRRIVRGGGTPIRARELTDQPLGQIPYVNLFRELLPHVVARPQVGGWLRTETLLGGEALQYLIGQKTLDQAVHALEKSGAQLI